MSDSSRPVSHIVFDIGKVLLDFDYGIFVNRMTPPTDMDESGLNAFLNQSPLLAKYESGQLTSAEFAEIVRMETGFEGASLKSGIAN